MIARTNHHRESHRLSPNTFRRADNSYYEILPGRQRVRHATSRRVLLESNGEDLATDQTVKGTGETVRHLDRFVAVARGRDHHHIVGFCE